jgi:hypothetical protein
MGQKNRTMAYLAISGLLQAAGRRYRLTLLNLPQFTLKVQSIDFTY